MNHSVEINGQKGAVHSHTWEISMGISLDNEVFLSFKQIEDEINAILNKYQDIYLNDMPPFDRITPTLENVCDYLYKEVSVILRGKGWLLLNMEMSETPARAYQVSEIGL